MQEGFVMITRDFFDSGYWRQSRTFTECEAILDIMQQVRFEASERLARIGGREVTWGQAEWPASIRFLADRWNWTDRKVRTFLSSLKRNEVITTDDSQGVNVIRLERFVKFGKSDTANDTASDTTLHLTINELHDLVTQQVTQCLTQQRHSSDTNTNKGNNIKKDSSLCSESKEKLDWSLLSDDMKPVAEEWLAYKREKRETYKPRGFQMFCKELIRLSGNDANKARLIVEQSMRNNYSGIFELKNGYETTTNNQQHHQEGGHPTDSELRSGSIRNIERIRAERYARQGEIWDG